VAWNSGPDINDGTPFGEFRAESAILNQSLAQSIEALGDDFTGREGKRLRSLVDLDAGNGSGLLDEGNERCSILRLLSNGLVVKDDAGNAFGHALGRAEQQLAIVAPAVRRGLNANGVETLLDGARGFVGSEYAAARRYHGLGDFVELSQVHAD